MEWLRFKHPAVRDLAWSLLSPSLLDYIPEPPSHNRQYSLNQVHGSYELYQWLETLDKHPEELEMALSNLHSTRLGIYFEALWQFYIKTKHQLIAHNLQINEPGRTLGELDFIYRKLSNNANPNPDMIHAEAAVKFYVGDPETCRDIPANENNWHAWIGPNAKDRLSLKMQHMGDHQLQLSRHDAARDRIKQTAGEESTCNDFEIEAILRGRFFYPYAETMPSPSFANPNHLRGLWCYRHQLDDFIASQETADTGLWLPLERHEWFSEVETRDQQRLLSNDQLINAFEGFDAAPRIIAKVFKTNTYGAWREKIRCFVMPNHWPRLGRPSTNT